MAAKIEIKFDGYAELKKSLDELGGKKTEQAVESALKASQQVVARKAAAAMTPHNKTGVTASSIIRDGKVEWTQSKASISKGFDISNGGMASQYLMYGTKNQDGSPHVTKDKKLYAAVFGKETNAEVQRIQRQAFEKVLERAKK